MKFEDEFNGDDAHLFRCIYDLLSMDADGVLVPHGIGGYGRKLLSAAASRLSANTPESSAAQGAMDTAIADTVLSFIDRMNDVDPVDPADKIVAEFVAAVMPHIDARIQGKRSVAAQPSDATAQQSADAIEAAELQTLLIDRFGSSRPAYPAGLYAWAKAALIATIPQPTGSAWLDSLQGLPDIELAPIAAQPRVDLTDERAAFEKYAAGAGYDTEPANENNLPHSYSSLATEIAWNAWQERALLANTAQGKPSGMTINVWQEKYLPEMTASDAKLVQRFIDCNGLGAIIVEADQYDAVVRALAAKKG